jgi:hypothetical protein
LLHVIAPKELRVKAVKIDFDNPLGGPVSEGPDLMLQIVQDIVFLRKTLKQFCSVED